MGSKSKQRQKKYAIILFSMERATVYIPDFGKAALIDNTNHSGCIDPRNKISATPEGAFLHPINQEPGEERGPGSSAGKVMALMGVVPTLSPKDAIIIVKNFETVEGRKFSIHFDDKNHGNDLDHNGTGCGHVDKASKKDNETLYGLSSDKVQEMSGLIHEFASNGDFEVEAPVLTGNHREEGVLVVQSDRLTVVPNIGDAPFFRFDETRHNSRLKRLAKVAQQDGVVVTGDELIKTATQQRNASVGLLAEGLPIFAVDLRNGKREAVLAGIVQPPRK